MAGTFAVVMGVVCAVALIAAVMTLFEDRRPQPERMSERWRNADRLLQLEHEDDS